MRIRKESAMCRGKNICSELGANPAEWDKNCPLLPPKWINTEINKFIEAAHMFIQGNRELCIRTLSTIEDKKITNWYIEHGQMSGMHRKNILDSPNLELASENSRDPLRAPQKYQTEVFSRDNYHCRYCGQKLISQKFMKSFIKGVNSDQFKKGSTNLTTHGIIHVTWPVADHVIPWNIGGQTNSFNLVASCGPCNYGKAGYTCEQMGITDPFSRPPTQDSWDGLSSREADVRRSA